MLLVYLKQYFELFEIFDSIDTGSARSLSLSLAFACLLQYISLHVSLSSLLSLSLSRSRARSLHTASCFTLRSLVISCIHRMLRGHTSVASRHTYCTPTLRYRFKS
jgi:hypothetical protein